MSQKKQTAKVYSYTLPVTITVTVVSDEDSKQRKDDMEAEKLAREAFIGMTLNKETLKSAPLESAFLGTEELDEDWDWFTYEGDDWDEYCGIKKEKF